jgi:serine/threonine protein kinase/ActR/RegA family two-component response regulator
MAKVLVVDDDPLQAANLEDWLTGEQHTVVVADTGFKGWENLKTGEYDYVILDWDLPDMNGPSILKKFREAGGTTPVLMLTSRNSLQDKAIGLDAGADDYLTKPFHVDELAARMRAHLRRTETQFHHKPLGTDNGELLKKADLDGSLLAARYEFLDILGEGGIGIVFKAKHPRLDKLVAVKMLQRGEITDEAAGRFEREAKAISLLDHTNIAIVHDFGMTEKRQLYMVMEFIEGQSLQEWIHENGQMPVAMALNVIAQVCDGLSHAHRVGVLHRDLKPSNIMLKNAADGSKVVKILDFGNARIRAETPQKAVDLTQPGQVFGSPPYMSPEQILGKEVDERSDIYSLGCVIYELLTGLPVHCGDTASEIMFKHATAEPTPIRQHGRTDVSAAFEELVATALAKEPGSRYQSVVLMKAELDQIKQGTGSGTDSAQIGKGLLVAPAQAASNPPTKPANSPPPPSPSALQVAQPLSSARISSPEGPIDHKTQTNSDKITISLPSATAIGREFGSALGRLQARLTGKTDSETKLSLETAIQTGLPLVFEISILSILAFLVLQIESENALIETSRTLTNAANELIVDFFEADASLATYITSGDESASNRFDHVVQDISKDYRVLAKLAEKNPAGLAIVEHLSPVVTRLVEDMKSTEGIVANQRMDKGQSKRLNLDTAALKSGEAELISELRQLVGAEQKTVTASVTNIEQLKPIVHWCLGIGIFASLLIAALMQLTRSSL